jgi:hypothetical protein
VLVVELFSCSEMLPGDGSFYVLKIKEGYKYTDYQLVQIKGHGATWVRDKRGKYHVGDTVRICNKHFCNTVKSNYKQLK